jgi:hypothetical protein
MNLDLLMTNGFIPVGMQSQVVLERGLFNTRVITLSIIFNLDYILW